MKIPEFRKDTFDEELFLKCLKSAGAEIHEGKGKIFFKGKDIDALELLRTSFEEVQQMEQPEIVYFSINNWFGGRDYPDEEPFVTWVGLNSPLDDGDWCKNQQICVRTGCIDMSRNWCVTATREWVKQNCPNLLCGGGYTYEILCHSGGKNIEQYCVGRYRDFVFQPDEDEDTPTDRFGWPFLEWSPENFGTQWYDEEENFYDEDEEDEE